MPWPDLHHVWSEVGKHLAEGGAYEPVIPREVRERGEALEQVKAVAKALGLPPDETPTIEQYKREHENLGLTLTARQIALRWEGWRFVKLAIGGEKPLETPAQRAQRRAVGQADTHRDAVSSLKLWLLPTPPPDTGRPAYDHWANIYNAQGNEQDVLRSGGIIVALGLPWSRCVQVGAEQTDLATAQAEHQAAVLKGSGQLKLVSVRTLAGAWGVTRDKASYDITQDDDFPQPAATLAGIDVWAYGDVERYRSGEPVTHQKGYLEPSIMAGQEVADRLGIKLTSLNTQVRRGNPDVVPMPEGSGGGRNYWMREDFEAWLEAHPRTRRALP